MVAPDEESLLERVRRHPAHRYPVQHATAQFHLGSALLQAGDTSRALTALATARRLFISAGLSLEASKAMVMLGIGFRAAGRLDEAGQAFRSAADALAALDQPAEQGAAMYNLGLVLQDSQQLDAARHAWGRAHELFLAAGCLAQAGTAARDHGASMLASGDVGVALPLLEQALTLAERAGDDPGVAAAANTLGLTHLAAGDAPSAVAMLRRALAFVSRAVRPADHAMIKANLALAYEHAGEPARARLAARQVAAFPAAPAPVRAQVSDVLARLHHGERDDLFTVLDQEDPAEWATVVRDEVLRAAELPREGRDALLRDVVDGLVGRPELSYQVAQTLLSVILELPPRPYALLIESVVAGCAAREGDDAERVRAIFSSAMARFAVPQWQRLAASFNAAAEAAGDPATWR